VKDTDVLAIGGGFPDDGAGVVGAAVIHDEEFEGVVLRVEVFQHPAQGLADASLFVISGDDNGEMGRKRLFTVEVIYRHRKAPFQAKVSTAL
jgi:hypothetical protein